MHSPSVGVHMLLLASLNLVWPIFNSHLEKESEKNRDILKLTESQKYLYIMLSNHKTKSIVAAKQQQKLFHIIGIRK